jgi:hypothetical protein
MLNAMEERAALARRLRAFARGDCPIEDVEDLAFDIRDRWASCSRSELPPKSDAELPLWAAVWDITATCRESLVASSGCAHPVLRHIAHLDGTEAVPRDWTARRP